MILTPLRRYLSLTSIVAILAFASPSFGQETVFDLDPAATHIAFILDGNFHTVHGTFQLKSGSIHFDPRTGAAGGLVVVDATSGKSGSGSRDKRMHKEILESLRYPEITFTPVSIQGHVAPQGTSQVELHGVMKLLGEDHDITLKAVVQPEKGRLSANTELTIPYVKWGLENPSTFILRVSSKVNIEIQATGQFTGLPSASTSAWQPAPDP